MKSTISFFVRSKNAIMQNGITNASHASFGLVEFKKMLIASSLGVLLPNAHAEDLKLASASSDSVVNVNAATQATVPPPVPSTTDYDALFAKLQPKGFNIGLPGPTDTVDPQAFGLRGKRIQVTDLNKTFNDPLAAKVRSLLRREYNFSRTPGRTYSVPCVFSTEQLRYPKPDGGVCQSKSFIGEGVKLDCAGGFGAVTMVTASFGMVAAARAVDKLVAGARRPSERNVRS